MEILKKINLEITNYEQCSVLESKENFFQNLLTENFIFRRANGLLVNKTEFMALLKKPSQFNDRISEILSFSIDSTRLKAVFEVKVTTVIDNDLKFEKKSYQNIRFFCCENTEWKLYAWYNQAF